MNAKIFSALLLQSIFALLVQATIYVTQPLPGTTCSGGQSCSVQWLDNGVVPLLTDIRACYVGLYNGEKILIQQIDPVDVSAQHSLTFTPDPKAGPNSDSYYINFTSVNPVGGLTYYQFSTMFTLNDMTGAFSAPVASDTAAIPVPSSLLSSATTSVTSTTTVSSSAAPSTTPASSASSASNTGAVSSTSTAASSSSSSSSSPSSSSSSSTSSSSGTSTTLTSTSDPGPATTLIVSPLASDTLPSTSVGAAPATSSTPSTSASQASSGSRSAAMPLSLSLALVFAVGLLM